MFWRKISLVLFVSFFVLNAPAPGYAESTSGDSGKETLVIGTASQRLNPLNPLQYENGYTTSLYPYLYNSLIKREDDSTLTLDLAKSFSVSQDKLKWTFELRKGVKFHDGVELTATDVKYSIDTLRNKKSGSLHPLNYFRHIKEVVVKDRHTVEILLNKSATSVTQAFASFILPKHTLDNDGAENFNSSPVGTGPYRFLSMNEWEISLELNKNFFSSPPHIQRVTVRRFKDRKEMWGKLVAGEVDLVSGIESEHNSGEILKVANIHQFVSPYYYLLAFNHKKKLFSDPKVRQALNFAIDKEAIIREALKNEGVVASGTVYPNFLTETNNNPYPYDPAKAEELFREAGWQKNSDGILAKGDNLFTFTIDSFQGTGILEKTAPLIQKNLAKIGIKTEINFLSWPDLERTRLVTKNFEAAIMPFFGEKPEDSWVSWHSSQMEGGFNVFSYNNPDLDKLLEQADVTFHPRERQDIYSKIQEEFVEEPPGIFLFWKNRIDVVNKRVNGVEDGTYGISQSFSRWTITDGETNHLSLTSISPPRMSSFPLD